MFLDSYTTVDELVQKVFLILLQSIKKAAYNAQMCSRKYKF
jgi:hypothetical protein